MKALVVTRHAALVEFLVGKGYISADSEVVEHATEETVKGKHVWGVLPRSLSCLCKSFTEVPMSIPSELRGKELSLDDMIKYAGKPVTYVVKTQLAQSGIMESCFDWGYSACTPSIDWMQEAIGEK